MQPPRNSRPVATERWIQFAPQGSRRPTGTGAVRPLLVGWARTTPPDPPVLAHALGHSPCSLPPTRGQSRALRPTVIASPPVAVASPRGECTMRQGQRWHFASAAAAALACAAGSAQAQTLTPLTTIEPFRGMGYIHCADEGGTCVIAIPFPSTWRTSVHASRGRARWVEAVHPSSPGRGRPRLLRHGRRNACLASSAAPTSTRTAAAPTSPASRQRPSIIALTAYVASRTPPTAIRIARPMSGNVARSLETTISREPFSPRRTHPEGQRAGDESGRALISPYRRGSTRGVAGRPTHALGPWRGSGC